MFHPVSLLRLLSAAPVIDNSKAVKTAVKNQRIAARAALGKNSAKVPL